MKFDLAEYPTVNPSRHLPSHYASAGRFERWTNQVIAAFLLVMLSPVFLVVAVLTWQIDGAPIFFGHYRVGFRGRVFRCLKFRTMYRNSSAMLAEILATDPVARAEWTRDQKLSVDPRVTPIGRFLRKSSLDELPQLLNVLYGEMNLVGPRPVVVEELTRYGGVRWDYLAVRPGITGLWQVSGRNLVSYEQRVVLDQRYVEKRSFLFDVSILLRTVKVLVTREGAS